MLLRKDTEVDRYVFDRGRKVNEPVQEAEYFPKVPPNVKLINDKHYSNQPIRLECDNWIKNKHGKWRPTNPNKASIMKLHQPTLMQSDSGANRIVTDNITSLHNIEFIEPYPMGGCNKDEIAITCTAKGLLPIPTTDGDQLNLEAYYSKDVDGTIISPTTIVRQYSHRFTSFTQHSDCDNNIGSITFHSKDSSNDKTVQLKCKNDLWYHENPLTNNNKACVKRISAAATYELWHQRTGHAGATVLQNLHKHAIGVPKLRGNAFYRCPSCMSGKLCTRRFGKSKAMVKIINDDTAIVQGEPGQHFHVDFGFVRGQDDTEDRTGIRENAPIVKSIDGYNCYVIVIDRVSRYTWIFLAKNKQPPVETIRRVLNKFKSSNKHRTIRTDQGGELGHSTKFAEMVAECGFTLEETGADASSQNGMAERPNRTYGEMMRCMLHSSELGPEFWSFALIYAVYIRNRLPHTSIKMSPYEAITGLQPDLTNLRIFGSRVYVRKTGKRRYKLDNHTSTGIFLGFTATQKNIRYIDESTATIKVGTHAIFDEAGMTIHPTKVPMAAQTLQRLGYVDEPTPSEEKTPTTLQIEKLLPTAVVPSRATPGSIGYDICNASPESIIIKPWHTAIVPTGIALATTPGTYVRIAPRSGLTVKNNLTTMAGVIDPDYRGEVKIVLHNFGENEQKIQPKQKIAQLILEKADTPTVEVVQKLPRTKRNTGGFGSTDSPSSTSIQEYTVKNSKVNKMNIIPAYFEPAYHLYLSTDPYDNVTSRNINPRPHDNNLLGMKIQQCPIRNLPQLIDCEKGSSSMRIPKWRSQLKHSYLTHVNNIAIYNKKSIERIIKTAREVNPNEPIQITFASIKQQSMHPQFGVPHLHHDQMNLIASHLWELRHKPEWDIEATESIITPYVLNKDSTVKAKHKSKVKFLYSHPTINQMSSNIKIPKKLTRRYLLQQDDWDQWQQSEFKQLDQYRSQGTLGEPTTLPKGANLLPLLWTYLIKDDGTRKARCVCNGSPRQRGSVTLANTYAGSLEQT